MAADAARAERRRGTQFLLLYALANAGGFVAYVPFLTLLLPSKMAAVAGGQRVEWLAAATLAGAVSASVSNIASGWASDRSGSRRPWVAAGLLLTLLSFAIIHFASTPPAIVGAIILYQAALNMMLSPLAAWAADAVPDERKGLLGGLMGGGQPLGALSGIVVTLPFLARPGMQLAATCAMFAALILPLLTLSGHGTRFDSTAPMQQEQQQRAVPRFDLSLLWFARLLVQIAGSILFAFLLYYFQSLPGRAVSEAEIARVSGFTLIAAFPMALLLGRASDRAGTRRPFLFAVAVAMSVGLAIMGMTRGFALAVAGYALFICGLTIFLSLHSVTAMQWLPSPRRRGRDLGLFNLTNTLPALLSPLLAVGLIRNYGFGGLMMALAAIVALAAALILAMKGELKAP